MPNFTVVARSRASAIFYPGKALVIDYQTHDGVHITCAFGTQYAGGYSAPLPVDMHVEVRGVADDEMHAARAFHKAAMEASNMIAFATNADLGKLEVELVFDSTPELAEHKFIQTFIPNVPVTHVPSRPIDPELVRDFLAVSSSCPEQKRVLTAIAQYCEALKRWNAGHGIICLAHLYMGVEALTKASLRTHLLKTGLSEDELAEEWKIEKKQLDNEVRRRLIFDGDVACFKLAKEVSDGFEHGFGDLSKMHEPAGESVVKVAAYLRKSIIMLTGAPQPLVDALLRDPYAHPRGPIRIIKKIKGALVGPVEKLAMDGRMYPNLVWKTGITDVTFDENGRYRFDPQENFTAELGDGVNLVLHAFEGWDDQLVEPGKKPNHFVPKDETGVKIDVTRAPAAVDSKEVKGRWRYWWGRMLSAVWR